MGVFGGNGGGSMSGVPGGSGGGTTGVPGGNGGGTTVGVPGTNGTGVTSGVGVPSTIGVAYGLKGTGPGGGGVGAELHASLQQSSAEQCSTQSEVLPHQLSMQPPHS